MKQLSEVWRRGIVTPLDGRSVDEMVQGLVSSHCSVQYLEIGDAVSFDSVWDLNLFQDINRHCDTLIDDYEDACIPPERLAVAISVVLSHERRTKDHGVSSFLGALDGLMNRALHLNHPVYFIL